MNSSTNPLWTRDFTIITLGTIVSMLGNAISGFALGLLVLDYTASIFLYSLFMIAYNLPKIIMPFLSGPYIDRFSRKKLIYSLDFLSSAIYIVIFLFIKAGIFSYPTLIVLCFIIGSIDSIYTVAYDSFYPTLITKGNFRKAYSISSMLYPLSAIMVPVAAYFYETTGLQSLFLFNAATFLIAAVFETQIKAEGRPTAERIEKYNFKQYADDFKNGGNYIKKEKGLLVITSYFFISSISDSFFMTLLLPYFKGSSGLGVMTYTYVMAFAILGRLLGGLLHYKFKYPAKSKFTIAFIVYVAVSVLYGTLLYMPILIMMTANLIIGILGVTSYNIRISSTQSYVPDDMRGRFNGTFQMCFTFGGIIGQLFAGITGELLPIKPAVLIIYAVNIAAAFIIMFRGRSFVKPIYNRDT